METLIFDGKKYNAINSEEIQLLGAIHICSFRVYPKDMVWVTTEEVAKIFNVPVITKYDSFDTIPSIFCAEDNKRRGQLYQRVIEGEDYVSDCFSSENGRDSYKFTLCTLARDKAGKAEVIAGMIEPYNNHMQQAEIIQALASDFYSIALANFETDEISFLRLLERLTEYGGIAQKGTSYQKLMDAYIQKEVIPDEREAMRRATTHSNLQKVLSKQRAFVYDYRVLRDGKPLFIRLKVVKMNEGPKLTRALFGFADVNQEKQAAWHNLAYVDPITGGNNYNFYSEQLKSEKRSGYVVSLDIASFKMVNSAAGIQEGDAVLKQVDTILKKAVGKKGYSAHVNADHFVFFVAVESEEDVIRILDRVTADFHKMVLKRGIPKIYPYFGVSNWEPGDRNQVVFSEANTAKHRIKDRKDINYGFYSEKDTADAIEAKRIEDAFEGAIAGKQFEIWYQPKYSPLDRSIMGAEALVRWRKPDGELVSPGKFIPVYEANGMIRQLDAYVFRAVCEQQKKWVQEVGRTVPISINLSRASLYHENVVEEYKQMAESVGILTELVPIEITESAAIDNGDIKSLAMHFFDAGFPLHIDDFGTGYSSLATLNMMRFDTLKLDKTLIDYIGEYSGDKLIQHTVALARDLGLHVTAEGVESADQVEFLKKIECDSVQGFFFARPMPAEFFGEMLRKDMLSERSIYRKGQKYTYPIIVENCRRAFNSRAQERIEGHAAIQINILGEGEGSFYIEIEGGKADVQPYEYYNYNVCITCNAENFFRILHGEISLEEAFREKLIGVDGDWGAMMLMTQFVDHDAS